jgi:hypothetical protein
MNTERAGSTTELDHAPGRREEVTMKDLLKRAWYSPALLLVLVYVLGSPRKFPKG